MEQYISKSALVAEVERRIKEYQSTGDDYWFPVIENLKNILYFVNTLEMKEVVDLEKSIDVDSMVTEYLKQYEEAGQTPFAMNIIGSAYRKGLEDMFRLKAQKGEGNEQD